MIRQWVVAMLGAAAMLVSAGATAQVGFYIGAEVGNADFGTEDDTAVKILGGYQVNRNFAVEVGYGLLFDKGATEVTALEAVAVGSLPVTSQFSVFGKLGLANVEVDNPGGSNDKTELTYGVGVQFDATPRLGVRGQWQRYDTDEEIDLISVGVIYRF